MTKHMNKPWDDWGQGCNHSLDGLVDVIFFSNCVVLDHVVIKLIVDVCDHTKVVTTHIYMGYFWSVFGNFVM